jgi:hypothetical protein
MYGGRFILRSAGCAVLEAADVQEAGRSRDCLASPVIPPSAQGAGKGLPRTLGML